jgi:ribonuclease T1
VRRRVVKLVLTGLLFASAWATGIAVAKEAAPAVSEMSIALDRLPVQGRETYQLIRSGGPFPYQKDGTVFGNRERLLPLKTRGYYREYTVPTPGSRNRGARRIVCGGEPRVPDACFYTADHYASFRRIVQ